MGIISYFRRLFGPKIRNAQVKSPRFKLSRKSLQRMRGVHPDMVRVVKRAIQITTVDFGVIEGVRTPARQAALYEKGASQTLNSRHLTGHAVDLGAYVGSKIDWTWGLYEEVAGAMMKAAAELNVPVVWGGSWKTIKDGPHFELNRKFYP